MSTQHHVTAMMTEEDNIRVCRSRDTNKESRDGSFHSLTYVVPPETSGGKTRV